MSSAKSDHALTIEGAVMFGFGATRCVEFAFQSLGIDVCPIVPAQYTNNIFYKNFVAKKLSADDISDIYETLKKNDLHRNFTIIKSGYLETAEELRLVGKMVTEIKQINPTAIYVCDPVVGDNGKAVCNTTIKSSMSIVHACSLKNEQHRVQNWDQYATLRTDPTPIYHELLLPIADISTPNQFEVECVSGIQIHSQDDAIKALQIMHDMGPSVVIMTSGKLDSEPASTTQACIGSRIKDGKREVYRTDFEYCDGYFVGTGDLFTGCFVGYLRKSDDLKTALEQAISTMQHICHSTFKHAIETAGPGNKPTPDLMEMRVVQCAAFLREPTITHPATKLL